MASFMPFSNKNLDIFMCALRPTVAIVDDLLDTLKHFSLFTETLGCIHSSIFKSIHGNLVPLSLASSIYVYMYVCMCMCVCVGGGYPHKVLKYSDPLCVRFEFIC
ncbi:hypothetical protein Hdeb2414_s0006g00197971 [Helianthus debilis subsp. tardiflorus]